MDWFSHFTWLRVDLRKSSLIAVSQLFADRPLPCMGGRGAVLGVEEDRKRATASQQWRGRERVGGERPWATARLAAVGNSGELACGRLLRSSRIRRQRAERTEGLWRHGAQASIGVARGRPLALRRGGVRPLLQAVGPKKSVRKKHPRLPTHKRWFLRSLEIGSTSFPT